MTRGRLRVGAAAFLMVIAAGALTSGQKPEPWAGVLDEHPAIQYATRPTTDRVATVDRSLAASGRSLRRGPCTGYLLAVLEALGVSVESQLLVFSKTGVQRAYTGPRSPRALFFNESVAVGYNPGAPLIELAATILDRAWCSTHSTRRPRRRSSFAGRAASVVM